MKTFIEKKYHRSVLSKQHCSDSLFLHAARYFFARKVEFITSRPTSTGSATDPFLDRVPEIAFMGHSNAGKSSLLNAISGADLRNAARISSRPGCTRMLNYFKAANGKIILVDLMGYGAGSQEAWGNSIDLYIKKRPSLSHIVWLLPSFQPKLEYRDFLIFEMLKASNRPFTLVLSQIDRFQSNLEFLEKLDEVYSKIIDKSNGYCSEIICTSVARFSPLFSLDLFASDSLNLPIPEYKCTEIATRRLGRVSAPQNQFLVSSNGNVEVIFPGIAELQLHLMRKCGVPIEYWARNFLKTKEGMDWNNEILNST